MDKPEPGKVYVLMGGTGTPSVAAGNTWAESEVREPSTKSSAAPMNPWRYKRANPESDR